MIRGAVFWCVGWAFGHPMGADGWATYTAVRVGVDRPDIVIAVEVPLNEGLERFRSFAGSSPVRESEEGFRAHMWSTMAKGLSVRSKGREVAGRWVPVWSPANGLAAESGFLYLLRFQPTRDDVWGPTGELTVTNLSFGDRRWWRSAWVEVSASCRVTTNTALETLPFLSPDPMNTREVWSRSSDLQRLTLGWSCVPASPAGISPTVPSSR